jgi:hypothetical protein
VSIQSTLPRNAEEQSNAIHLIGEDLVLLPAQASRNQISRSLGRNFGSDSRRGHSWIKDLFKISVLGSGLAGVGSYVSHNFLSWLIGALIFTRNSYCGNALVTKLAYCSLDHTFIEIFMGSSLNELGLLFYGSAERDAAPSPRFKRINSVRCLIRN